MSDGRVVGTDVMVSSLGKGKELPADAQQSVVPDEGVVLANRCWRVNGDGGAGLTVVYRNTVVDGRVVLADGGRCVDGDGVAVPTVVSRELMQDGRAALAGG